MTSVTIAKCLASKTPLDQVLRRLPLFNKRPRAPKGAVQQAVGISLNETLDGLHSADLEAIATVLRNVVGQIDTLLLKRQLAECGFDAVRAVPYGARHTSMLEPADAPVLSNSGAAT